ncbi:MAG: DUF5665 domain-containing protein [Clostridia bacterium]|nr:DUF5665 domain-containing protein [Clostridia bacterium]
MEEGQSRPDRQEARLARRVRELCLTLEKMRLTEYMRYLNDVRRLLWVNFLTGLARGFGTAIGFTILGAIAIAVLQRVTVINLPIIGRYLADVVRIVQENLAKR